MQYSIYPTKQYQRDLQHMKKMGKYNFSKLDDVINTIARQETLSPLHCDHPLHGNWKGYRECHIQGDWLLIYRKFDDVLLLQLMRTGRHTDVFEE